MKIKQTVITLSINSHLNIMELQIRNQRIVAKTVRRSIIVTITTTIIIMIINNINIIIVVVVIIIVTIINSERFVG